MSILKKCAIAVVSIGMLAATMTFAATIKKKDGQVVTGEIQGLIVQKGNVSKSGAGAKITYSANYQLTNGIEISAVDEEGVHWTTDKVYFFSVSQEGVPLDDVDVIETGTNTPAGSIFGGYTKAGGSVVAIGGRTKNNGGTCSDRLLGEFRINPDTKKGQIIPALELMTAGGMIKIQVAEIAAFTKAGGEVAPSTTRTKPSSTQTGKAAISDSTSKETKPSAAAPAHSGQVTALAITPDSRLLASASFDGTIKLWSLPVGKLIRSLEGHKSGVYSMVMSADGSNLISGSHEDSIIVWSLPGGEIAERLDSQTSGSTTAMAIAPTGNLFAAGTFTSALTLWSWPQKQLLKTIRAAYGLNDVAFTPDGSIVAGGSFGPIELWSVPDGSPLGTLPIDRTSVNALAVTPNGEILASASENENNIRLWSLTQRKLLTELTGNNDGVLSLAIASGGKTLAAGCGDGMVRLWSLPDGALQAAMPGHKDKVCALSFSPDGNLIASGDKKGVINLWDCQKKVLIRSLSPR